MNEVVTRIRKETKAKLKEVVKEATRRLDGDTERMFEQALHTIVRHYDSVSGSAASDNGQSAAPAAANAAAAGKSTKGRKKGPTLNKDGTPRKPRAPRAGDEAAPETAPAATPAASGRGRKPAATAAKTKTTGAKRGPKPAAAPASTGAKRGPKPRVQAAPAPDATDVMNSADSPSTGEVSA